MEGNGSIGKKLLGFGGQILVVSVGVIAGILILEAMRKPRISPPAASPAAPAQSS